jgi:aminoglycoside phosphotransferase (APT) family kinase protein
MELGPLLAEGRTAEIYAWEDGKVIKLFREWVPRGNAEYEARLARLVHASGMPVPAVGDLIEVKGRPALIYERVEGRLLMDNLERQRLQRKIQDGPLPENLKEASLQALASLPDDDRLCHGDFHPGNVLVNEQGSVVIDWIDASKGHPMGDVARTWVLARFSGLNESNPLQRWLTGWMRERFISLYLSTYFSLAPGDQTQLVSWAPVIAAARLEEGVTDEEAALLAFVRSRFEGN